jgi:hypothetical protein
MKKISLFIIIHLVVFCCFGQVTILPGDKSIDESFIKPGLTTLGYYYGSEAQGKDIGTYEIEISIIDKKITVNSTLYFKNTIKEWKDVCVAEANSFKPMSYSSDRNERFFELSFSNTITGKFTTKQNNATNLITQAIKEKYFDINIYPHVIRTLPLKLGYKAILPVYDYEAIDKSKLYNVVIKEVKTDIFNSLLTGKHEVWKVLVFEESTGHNFEYLIDKKSRRIWQINIVSKDGLAMMLLDRESDFNPVKQTFDREATKNMITKGNSVITGQVFGRANKNDESWAVIVNWNPKQFARKGTAVYLIPYTSWYKEYFEVNRSLKKEGRKYNMPKEALECVLVSTVYDDKGHFEFANLMPGEYFVYCEFLFYEKHHQDIVVGTRDVFQGNVYMGSSDITQRNRWSKLEYAFSEEIVNIKSAGQKKEISMKKQKRSQVL